MESPKGKIIIRENPLFDNSTPAFDLSEKESHLEVVSVMMADVTPKTAMVEMERKISFLMKVFEERDHEIAALKDQMKACKTAESRKTPTVKANDKGKVVLQENYTQWSISGSSLSVQQLQHMITSTIRAQYRGPSQTSFMYSKSYIKRINDL
ncbi:ty3-gypsy retrotransposon protein [Cucumis melo var. makuwa]|uniref:Ty3-gypsy retrotransposon protein n=1 Tax=Cucumis melo var. makuwa TaxID=1194695 RepID=A0A5D3C172_CUCMM|nr:ty3-gypsy retrotransposon protein [Cucumis melo var. makuwa]